MIIFLKGFIKLGIVTKAKQFCDFINIHFGRKAVTALLFVIQSEELYS